MNLSSLEIKEIHLPTEIILLNKNKFKVKIGKVEGEFDWETLKEYFTRGRDLRDSMSPNIFTKLMDDCYGMKKEEMFQMLKEYKMLQGI